MLTFTFARANSVEPISTNQCLEIQKKYEYYLTPEGEGALNNSISGGVTPKNIIYDLLPNIIDGCPGVYGLKIFASNFYTMVGNYDLGLQFAIKAVADAPRELNTRKNLASKYALNNKTNEAIHEMRFTLSLFPNEESLLIGLCSTLEFVKNYREAIVECDNYINKGFKMRLGLAHFVIGRSYEMLNMPIKSKQSYMISQKYGYDPKYYYGDAHYGRNMKK